MKLVELVRQQLVQLFKNYSGQDNELKKYAKFMSCIFEPMEKDLRWLLRRRFRHNFFVFKAMAEKL